MDTQTFHRIYVTLFESELPLTNKQLALEAAANCKASWRATHVSAAALAQLRERRSAADLRRGHHPSRNQRARLLFACEIPVSAAELHETYWRHDTTTVVTTAENARDGKEHWSSVVEVPDGVFSGGFSVAVTKSGWAWILGELGQGAGASAPPRPGFRESLSAARAAALRQIEEWLSDAASPRLVGFFDRVAYRGIEGPPHKGALYPRANAWRLILRVPDRDGWIGRVGGVAVEDDKIAVDIGVPPAPDLLSTLVPLVLAAWDTK